LEVDFDIKSIFEDSLQLYHTYDRQTPDLKSHYLVVKGADQRSRMTYVPGSPSLENAKPEQLNDILSLISEAVEKTLEPLNEAGDKTLTITSGVNMASEISMPTLCGTCAVAALETELQTDGTVVVFGDDVAAVFSKDVVDPAAAIDTPRREFGLIPKEQATGVQSNPESMTVFCERFFNGHGDELNGPKPGSIVRLLMASSPGKFFGKEEDEEDFEGICRVMRKYYPDLISGCNIHAHASYRKKRTTSSRRIASEMLSMLPRDGCSMTPKKSDELLAEVERHVLWLIPSTRGKPERVSREKSYVRHVFSEGQAAQARALMKL
jgi:hypothetical protein